MKKQSERLGIEPIPQLLAKLAVPATVGMLIMALHSVIDTIYVARGVGTIGVAAIAITFPLHLILMALIGAIGIGGSAVISIALGAKDLDKANQAFGNVLIMVILVSVVSVLLGLIFLTPMLRLFGASVTILPYASVYLKIILYGTIFFAFPFAVNNIVRAEGNASIAMINMIMSAVLNVILTPIFMFGFNLGISGAAYGTIMAQAITSFYLLFYFYTGRSTLSIKSSYLYPRWVMIKGILSIGASAFVRQGSSSIMLIIANNLLVFYGGDMAIAALGIIHRVMMFTLMPIFGVVQGLLPLVGFNYGAKHYHRVNESIVLAIKVSTAIAVAAFILVMAIPGPLMFIFTNDPELIAMGQTALRIIFSLSFTVGIQMVTGGIFQALGNAKAALVLSLSRQVLFLIPLLLILPRIYDLAGIWLAFPLADVLSLMLALWYIYRYKFFSLSARQELLAAPER
ncbi:MAG TPA: MATE family efflux transporter [Candidatus Limnocylindrales bacterium]|nr:MATE family efflux transporter [Candidatus Limnocylindrales bacterium]